MSVAATATMNLRVAAAKYAVRGAIPARAAEHAKTLASGQTSLPFEKLLWCNIGNPQAVGMKPMTFYRDCMAAIVGATPRPDVPEDIERRVREYRESFNIGAYTDSTGSALIRNQVADFLHARDSFEVNPDHIMLSNGASEAASLLMQTVIRDDADDEVLIPIPQYPLYSATITLVGAKQKEYYLNEEDNWSFDPDAVHLSEKTRFFVAINPGNPTGACLPEDKILQILQKIEREAPNCIVVADEVYQDNIWQARQPFVSFRRVAMENNINVPIATMHSTSKGLIGECGARGGFCHLQNMDDTITEELFKLRSISLCPGTYGQMMMGLLVSPPKAGDASWELFSEERRTLQETMERKALKTQSFLNGLDGVSCSDIEGAMYAFPSLTLPESFESKAKQIGLPADELYCRELLDATGIVTVPGSGFGQKDGTYHLRTTILPQEEDLDAFFPAWGDFHEGVMRA